MEVKLQENETFLTKVQEPLKTLLGGDRVYDYSYAEIIFTHPPTPKK